MKDIRVLEQRIQNLEYYTSLSLLETAILLIYLLLDENGLNKFKSGFFVDNFTTILLKKGISAVKNSIDIKRKELDHHTTQMPLICS